MTYPFDEGGSGDRPDERVGEFVDERVDSEVADQFDRAQDVTRERFGSGDERSEFGTDSNGGESASDSFGDSSELSDNDRNQDTDRYESAAGTQGQPGEGGYAESSDFGN
jgi:hypothetical protein